LAEAREAMAKQRVVIEEQVRQAVEQGRKAGEEARKQGVQVWQAQGAGGANPFLAVRVGTGRLGVAVEKPSAALADQLDLPKDQGLVIHNVTKDSAAAKAGLKANDVLLEIDGKAVVNEAGGLRKLLDGIEADETVSAVVLRKGKKVTVQGIKLPEVKEPKPGAGVFKFEDGKFMPINPGEFKLNPGQFQVKPGEFKFQVQPVPGGQRWFVPGVPGVPGVPPAKGGKASRNVSVQVNDGQFTATQTEGDVKITVKGTVADGKVDVSDISIEEPGAVHGYKDLDKVPEKYRDAVKALISGTGGVKFDFRREEKKEDGNKDGGSFEGRKPQTEVRGTVSRVEGDYVTLTAGADHGMTIGRILHAYRTQPTAEYVGRVQVLAASPQKAVARVLRGTLTPVRAGDTVVESVTDEVPAERTKDAARTTIGGQKHQ
jgi:hypothetical protein